MGWLYLALTITGFTGVTFFMKWGGQRGGSPLGLAAALFIVASLLTAVPFFAGTPLSFTRPVLLYGVLAGVGGAVALVLFANALKIGHYGFSVAVLHMSCLIPVVFSVVFLNEPLATTKVVGIAIILFGLFLVTSSSASSKDEHGGHWARWAVFIAFAFLLNGIPQVAQSAVAKVVQSDYAPFLFINYLSGALVLLIFALKGGTFDKAALLFGAAGAVGSVTGYFCVLKALETLSTPTVFPISLNGPVLAAVVLSRLFFREKISALGYLGIAGGIAGIIILAL